MPHYLIIIEKGDTSYGAYVPDLPGCVAVGDTRADVERDIRDAIALHIEGLARDGELIPTPAINGYLPGRASAGSRRLTTRLSIHSGGESARWPSIAPRLSAPSLSGRGVGGEVLSLTFHIGRKAKNRLSRWRFRHWRDER
jgi:predicted RNase H-like HicB family nuclease